MRTFTTCPEAIVDDLGLGVEWPLLAELSQTT